MQSACVRYVYFAVYGRDADVLFCLATFFALRQPIIAARKEKSVVEEFALTPPASTQKVLMLCASKPKVKD